MTDRTPPSHEALTEIARVADRVLAGPGETVAALLVVALIDTPEGRVSRWAIEPRDAWESIVEIVRRRIEEEQ
jgi:hypothetical protein